MERYKEYQIFGDDTDNNNDGIFTITWADLNWKLFINSPGSPSWLVGAQLVAGGTRRSGSGTRRPCCVSAALRPLMMGTGNP